MTGDAARLLAAVADALNACDRGGLHVCLDYGVVVTEHGYVLPLGEPRLGNRWKARMKVPTPGSDED